MPRRGPCVARGRKPPAPGPGQAARLRLLWGQIARVLWFWLETPVSSKYPWLVRSAVCWQSLMSSGRRLSGSHPPSTRRRPSRSSIYSLHHIPTPIHPSTHPHAKRSSPRSHRWIHQPRQSQAGQQSSFSRLDPACLLTPADLSGTSQPSVYFRLLRLP